LKAKKFLGMYIRRRRRRRRSMEKKDIAQELFLDSDTEDVISSHESDSDIDQENTIDDT
jgi:hypothetical protein